MIYSEGSGAILHFTNNLIGLQLKDNLSFLKHAWHICNFGGHLDEGELEFDCLKRELLEELELDIQGFEIEKVGTFNYLFKPDITTIDNSYIIYDIDLTQINKINEGSLVLLNLETNLDNLKIFPPLKEGIYKGFEIIRQRYLNKN